jgi:predicted lipid-binding transport protein (Tim44 family)
MGVVMGLLNGVWAATVLLGPLAAGLAAGRLSAQAVFGLTAVACLAVLAITVLATGSFRRPARVACAPASDLAAPGDLSAAGDLPVSGDLSAGGHLAADGEQMPSRSRRGNG